ncbi:MAG: ISAzo13 family transposase [Terracidiphilus sp.]
MLSSLSQLGTGRRDLSKRWENTTCSGYCTKAATPPPAFAVDAIALWWKSYGQKRYPKAKELLILADAGGANSARARGWKYHLQHQLANPYGLKVTVCHYPPGSSKWNPIEHRLFSQISNNWAGRPLESYETVLNYIRTTSTSTGLEVDARMLPRKYEKGEAISAGQMRQLMLANHTTLPAWNYTLTPSTM